MSNIRLMTLPRTAQVLLPLAAIAFVLTTAVALLSANVGLPGMHLMRTFGLSRGTAEWIVNLLLGGSTWLVKFLFPFLIGWLDYIVGIARAFAEAAIQW